MKNETAKKKKKIVYDGGTEINYQRLRIRVKKLS